VRKYKIGKTFHPVFEDEEEIPENINFALIKTSDACFIKISYL